MGQPLPPEAPRVDGRLRVFHNAFLLEFDDAGACRSFRDIYLEQR